MALLPGPSGESSAGAREGADSTSPTISPIGTPAPRWPIPPASTPRNTRRGSGSTRQPLPAPLRNSHPGSRPTSRSNDTGQCLCAAGSAAPAAGHHAFCPVALAAQSGDAGRGRAREPLPALREGVRAALAQAGETLGASLLPPVALAEAVGGAKAGKGAEVPEGLLCPICLEARGLPMVPCGHEMCLSCAHAIWGTKRNQRLVCPFCRGIVTSVGGREFFAGRTRRRRV